MSIFDDACAQASAAVDFAFADDTNWIYQPFATAGNDVNARPIVDPVRAPTTIVATFIDSYARAGSGGVRHQGVKAEKPGHASDRPQIYFDATQLAYSPQARDRVTRCKTGKVYWVAEVKPDLAGPRVFLDLNDLT